MLRGTGRAVPCGKDDFTAQRVAVAGLTVADQFHAYPACGPAVVAVKRGRGGHVGNEAVEIAVVVEVGQYHAARRAFFVPAGLFGNIDEIAVFVQINAVGFKAEDAAAAHVRPAVGIAVHVGVGQGDLGVPIPIIGANGLFFVVGIVGHAVGLHDVEAAVAVEVAESRTPAEPPFVEDVAAGGFVFEHVGIGLAALAVVHPQQAAFGL